MKTKTQYWKALKLSDKGKIISGYDGSEWKIGEWRSVPAPERGCVGLNCSEHIADAMGYVEIAVLAEVEIAGAIIKGDDKITCEKMRLLHAYRWEKKDSVLMAIHAAELVIENYEKEYPNDSRPRKAIEAAMAWVVNPCKETESAAWSAESAARLAARSAESAESAARSAARSAESAARSAASKKMENKIQKWIVSHIRELQEIAA